MRKYLILITVCIYNVVAYSQNVGIGTSNPQNKLHVGGGFRLDTLTGVNGAGLLRHDANGVVYGIKFSGNTSDVLRGDGSFGAFNIGGAIGWLLNGNSGTNPATNFIGTIDNQPLLFKVNNIRQGYLSGNNIFLGSNAGLTNTVNGIIGIGNGSLQNNIEGVGLLAVGDSVLHNNSYGSYNTAIGNRSMYQNFLGWRNTAIGYETLSKTFEGNDNTAIGYRALFQNTAFNDNGQSNTAVGSFALSSNTWGSLNTATGYRALSANQTGVNNCAFGAFSLMNNTSLWNSAFGANALSSNTTGFANSALGRGALFNNTIGSENTAIGTNALFNNNVTGNTAVGYRAMALNTSGNSNNAFGAYALETNVVGSGNSAFGWRTLQNHKASTSSAFGANALRDNQSGGSNTAVGYSALISNQTGGGNTGLGFQALSSNLSGFFNTGIGHFSGTSLPNNVSNVTVLGYATGWNTTSSNQVNIGNFSVLWIGGQVGWFHYSDKRIKNDIKDDVPGLAFITKLKPITYHVDIRKQEEIANSGSQTNQELIRPVTNNDEGIDQQLSNPVQKDWEGKYDIEKIKMTGFFAQDVEEAAKAINYSFSGVHNPKNGGLYSLDYSAFVVPLVKAVQEQQKIIEDQNKKIEKQQQQIDLLIKEMQSLKKDLITQKN